MKMNTDIVDGDWIEIDTEKFEAMSKENEDMDIMGFVGSGTYLRVWRTASLSCGCCSGLQCVLYTPEAVIEEMLNEIDHPAVRLLVEAVLHKGKG